jgi:DNA-binding NarL/FixJ family response regulator
MTTSSSTRSHGTAATATAPVRVMCVDDHRLMREGIRRIVALQPDMVVVAEASSGAEAVEQYVRHKPDVTLMDLQLPSMNGHEAIKAIRRVQPDARIVVLTMYMGDEDVYRAIEAGVMGYILKDAVPDDLIHVIREVHAGRRSIPAEIEAVLDARATQPSLTVREFQVLQLLATGKRNKEIASALGISADTTNAHVKSIFQKFNVHDRTAALAEAIRRGIIHIG